MELLDHTQDSHGEDAELRCEIFPIDSGNALKLKALMKLPAFWRSFCNLKIPTSKPRTRARYYAPIYNVPKITGLEQCMENVRKKMEENWRDQRYPS
jgi:hypothetical protein